ncbi:MAG TPA: bifunctional phosphoribosylaminoimidazolecarboxamide formyltransferase/IMP cyclohydrolase [Candidatus Polarisedimenticolia bacterium]|nr:bifunctional phosphoribosylaminoimidazolecarboxamide formyltransferase/IMP cyclohydrolase [Candidatus Polarisedimenticolia bacterium]
MTQGIVPVRRALISVFDKTGVVDLARGLERAGAEIVSTGGTARALVEAGLRVREVSDLTGHPEMLDGRVKTLHPRVHGGLLAIRGNENHMRQASEHGIGMIDLVAINLYPFEQTMRRNPADHDAVIEMIDIGGPAMIRSAAKNFHDVMVLVDPADYPGALEEIHARGGTTAPTRRALAARAFAHTACYDALIADFMERQDAGERAGGEPGRSTGPGFPRMLPLAFRRVRSLRYGENPHQSAALYEDPLEPVASAVRAEQLQGKELSFNNILDLDSAWCLVCDFDDPACAIIKHTNPAGAALGPDAAEAFRRALAADPVSAFGGVVAFNRALDEETARQLSSLFLEAVIAPDVTAGAAGVLSSKKNLRVLKTGGAGRLPEGRDYKRVAGGLLAQTRDRIGGEDLDFKVVTRRAPAPDEVASMRFAWTIVRHVKSNAIVYARGTTTAGVGAGQMSRVDAVRFGAAKATGPLTGCTLASDAFFPFRDGLDEAARAGVTAVVQPGGSVRDEEVIRAADEHDVAMVFTGRRHFRH